MAGSRKFSLEHMSRDDLAALTPEAAEISGIPYIMDADKDEIEKLMAGAIPARRRPRPNHYFAHTAGMASPTLARRRYPPHVEAP